MRPEPGLSGAAAPSCGTTRTDRAAGRRGTCWSPVLVELYRNHYDDLCRLARSVVRCEQTAHDVTQDAFVLFHRADGRCAPGRELQYLRSIVMNTARSRVRREVRERTQVPGVARVAPSPETECVSEIGFRTLLQGLRALPNRQRETMWCRFVLGHSERETAEVLHISAGSVKTHVSRARAAMLSGLSA